MSMTFQEIAAVALDEWEFGEKKVGGESRSRETGDGVVSESPTEDAGKTFTGGIPNVAAPKPVTAGGGNGGGNAQKPPENPTSPMEMQQSLSKHDERYHKGGFKEGTQCSYRDKMAATAANVGMLTPALKQQLGQTAVNNGKQMTKNEEQTPEFDAFKAARDKLNHINKAKNPAEFDAARKEFDAARDAYIKKSLGDAEYSCVNGLKKLVAMGGDKAQKIIDKMKGIVEKFKGQPQEEAAKSVLETAGVGGADESAPSETAGSAVETTGSETSSEAVEAPTAETPAEGPGAEAPAAPEAEPTEAKRYTEEGIRNRLDEIQNGLLEEGADVGKLMDERRELNNKLEAGDFDAPSKEDLDNKYVKALKKRKEAKSELDAAKSELDAAKQEFDSSTKKADKDEAEQKVAEAEQKVAEAEQKLSDAERDAKGAEFDAMNYKEPEPKSEGEGEGEGKSPTEHQIGKKTYVDLDEIEKQDGFLASLGAAFKAGWEGKEIVTGWDKMTGRWDKIAGGAKNDKQKADMKALQDEMARTNFLRGLKRKAYSEQDAEVKEMYEQAVSMLENNGKVGDIVKYLDKRKGELHKQGQGDEMHAAKLQQQMANNAKSAAQAFAAEAANREKYREQTVKESQPDVYNAIAAELAEEERLGDNADPTKIAGLKNILHTLENDKSVKNINKAIADYGKGWSHKAKNDEAMKAIKAQNVHEDNLEHTWTETNKDGKLKNLDAAIETLEKRKDDAGKAAAAKLSEIRKELATTHSEKRVQALLKSWETEVSRSSAKNPSNGFDLDIPDETEMSDSQREVNKQMNEAFAAGPTEESLNNMPAPDQNSVDFEKEWKAIEDSVANNTITADQGNKAKADLKAKFKAERNWEKPEYDSKKFAASMKSFVDNLDSAFGNFEKTEDRAKEITDKAGDNGLRKNVADAIQGLPGFKLHNGVNLGVNEVEYTLDTKVPYVDPADGQTKYTKGSMMNLRKAADDLQRELGPDYKVSVEELSGANQGKIKITDKKGSFQMYHSTKELFKGKNLDKINSSPCPIIRGFGPNGEAEIGDMTKEAPHSMTVGGTGSGKTELAEANLAAWLSKDPKYVRPMILDGKGNFRGTYKGVPGLSLVGPGEINLALKKLINESRKRADLMSKYGVRDIAEWNSRFPQHPMPYIPIVFDEVNSANEVNPENDALLGELSRISRASGIHVQGYAQELGTKNGKPGGISTGTRNNMTQGGVTVLKSDGQAAINAGVPEAKDCVGNGDGFSLDSRGNKHRIQGPYTTKENKQVFANWLINNRKVPPTTPPAAPASSSGGNTHSSGATA